MTRSPEEIAEEQREIDELRERVNSGTRIKPPTLWDRYAFLTFITILALGFFYVGWVIPKERCQERCFPYEATLDGGTWKSTSCYCDMTSKAPE